MEWMRIVDAVSAGQTGIVIPIGTQAGSWKQFNKLCHRIEASEELNLDCKGTVWHASGTSVAAIASWHGTVAVTVHDHTYRFKLLTLDRMGQRILYAVPVSLLDKKWRLPDIEFSDEEMQLLLQMADAISGKKAGAEHEVVIVHPAKPAVKAERDRWSDSLDQHALVTLLQDKPWLLRAITAALDAQMRSFKRFHEAPLGAFNFTTSGIDLQADQNFVAVLQALNFTASGKLISEAPPEIQVREIADLADWYGCIERVALIRTATGSALTPLLDQIYERERLLYCGGVTPPPLPTVPIIRSKGIFHRPLVVDVELPRGEPPLTYDEQDMLRTATARVLTHKCAQAAYDRWRIRMHDRRAYRFDRFRVWREVLDETFLMEIAGKDFRLRGIAKMLFSDSHAQQQMAEEAREKTIARALELIASPDRYEQEIAERPKSKAEAVRILDEDQDDVAFRFIPTRGDDAGKRLLAFSRESLLRLLGRVSCGETFLEAILARAEKNGLLNKRNRTIRLGTDTYAAITFHLEKF